MRRQGVRPALILLLIAVGALLGTIVGEIVGEYVPVLTRSASVALDPPVRLSLLNTFDLTLGLKFRINAAGAIGILLVLLAFRRI